MSRFGLNVLCYCRYEVIENDLLGSLQLATHHIAPYKTGGAEKASEISAETMQERASQKVVPVQHDEDSESRSTIACPSVANGEWVKLTWERNICLVYKPVIYHYLVDVSAICFRICLAHVFTEHIHNDA